MKNIFLSFFTISTFCLASSELPIYDGTSLSTIAPEDLNQITDKLEQLEAGYQTRLGKSYLDNRIQLREEIQKALSEMDLSVDLFRKTMDVGGYDIRPRISAGLETQRAVRLVSQGEFMPDQTPGSYHTRFLVSTEVSLYKKAGLEAPMSTDGDFRSSLGLYSYETGVSVQKISFVNSLEDYMLRSKDDEGKIRGLVASEKEINSYLQSEKKTLEQQIQKPQASSRPGRIAEKYTISEQLRIFLKGCFVSPKKQHKTFIKFLHKI